MLYGAVQCFTTAHVSHISRLNAYNASYDSDSNNDSGSRATSSSETSSSDESSNSQQLVLASYWGAFWSPVWAWGEGIKRRLAGGVCLNRMLTRLLTGLGLSSPFRGSDSARGAYVRLYCTAFR